MALSSSLSYVQEGRGYGWVSVGELVDAVSSNLLTAEEARIVLWSQLPALQHQATVTPPAIEKASA